MGSVENGEIDFYNFMLRGIMERGSVDNSNKVLYHMAYGLDQNRAIGKTVSVKTELGETRRITLGEDKIQHGEVSPAYHCCACPSEVSRENAYEDWVVG